MFPTQDHAEILRWAEARKATPAEISPFAFDSEPAILRFVFGDFPKDEPEIRQITWESFFAQFDLLGLSLVWRGAEHYELVYVQKKEKRVEIEPAQS